MNILSMLIAADALAAAGGAAAGRLDGCAAGAAGAGAAFLFSRFRLLNILTVMLHVELCRLALPTRQQEHVARASPEKETGSLLRA